MSLRVRSALAATLFLFLVAVAPCAHGEACEILRKPTLDGSLGEVLFIPSCFFERLERDTDGTFEAIIKALPVLSDTRWKIEGYMNITVLDNARDLSSRRVVRRSCQAVLRERPAEQIPGSYALEEAFQTSPLVMKGTVTRVVSGWYARYRMVADHVTFRVDEVLSDQLCGVVRPGDELWFFQEGGSFQVGPVQMCNEKRSREYAWQVGDHMLINGGPGDLYHDGFIAKGGYRRFLVLSDVSMKVSR